MKIAVAIQQQITTGTINYGEYITFSYLNNGVSQQMIHFEIKMSENEMKEVHWDITLSAPRSGPLSMQQLSPMTVIAVQLQ